MFALFGILGLIVFTYIRPQEFVPSIAGVPWINLWFLLMIAGFGVDWGMNRVRKEKSQLLLWMIGFYFWTFFTLLMKQPGELAGKATQLTTAVLLSIMIQHGAQNLKAFMRIVTVVFVTSMFCVTVAFHQGFQDFQCVIVKKDLENKGGPPELIPDGRSCERVANCEEEAGADEDEDYWCEHVGMFGSTSVSTGRVRWRGVLNDPNEITLAAGTSIPYAFAFYESKRTLLRLLLVLSTVIVVAVTDVFSQSRGAILIFAAVLGIYFVRKYGIRGGIAGAGMAAPLMMLGGRSGEEAAQSAEERLEVLTDGLNMFFSNPIFGVGYDQFTKHAWLTAHNSYVLAAAELGIFGFFLWMMLVFLILKTMVLAYQRYANVPGGEQIRAWALGLFASFCGTLVGIFFLSWTYHFVFWIYVGVAGGFYTMIRDRDRHFVVKPTRNEMIALFVFCGVFMVMLRIYVRFKGH